MKYLLLGPSNIKERCLTRAGGVARETAKARAPQRGVGPHGWNRMNIHLDTNIINWIFENPKAVSPLAARIRSGGHRVGCSIELLFELGNNPDTLAAIGQLEFLGSIVDWRLLSREPKHLIEGELRHVLDKQALNPYFHLSEAKETYARVLANVRAGTIEPIRVWAKSRNKGFFQRERDYYAEIERHPEASLLDPRTPFLSTVDSFNKTGLIAKYLKGFSVHNLKRELSDCDLETIFSKMGNLPAMDTLLTHHVAYFHFRHILKNPPFKRGSNMDARHLLSASRSDIFLSNDEELLGLISVADDRWRFKALRPQSFLISPD